MSTTASVSQVKVASDKSAAGGAIGFNLVGRQVESSRYGARVRIEPGNVVRMYLLRNETSLASSYVLGSTYQVGQVLNLKLSVTGVSPTTVAGKVWLDGAAEPAGWNRQATDATAAMQVAGPVGIVSSVSSASTVASTVLSYDDYLVTTSGSSANQPPTAAFTSKTTDLTVAFDASTSADPDGTIATYAWDFGDGTTGTGRIAAHVFATAGDHVVRLSVTDNLAAAGTRNQTVVTTLPAGPTDAPAVAIADPDPADSVFSWAVVPDTQQEVVTPGDTRMPGRFQWLADHESSDDIRFTIQTGDLVNWSTPDNVQYERAAAALDVLEEGDLPYFLNIGNHDTEAVCAGGVACTATYTPQLVRVTRTFNDFFPASAWGVDVGMFEQGKVDNTYSTVAAGGVKWLVLNLELWPRQAVIDWAKQVVSAHADYNVIVSTHSLLNEFGTIEQSREYGSNSPQQLYDQLILKYSNIKLAFCGHRGTYFTRTDPGVGGNSVITMQTNRPESDTVSNPLRMVQVDTAASTVRTWAYSPNTGETVAGTDETFALSLIR